MCVTNRQELSSRRRARRPGRPLDPRRDAAILGAALEGLAELGYDRLSIDEIAARAHAGKGAIYRRWPSKAALIVDAIVAWRDQVAPLAMPDTGSLAGDFEAVIAAVPDFDEAARRQIGVILGLASAAARDPELRTALTESALARPRALLRGILERAVARGEIPRERDLGLVPDILLGMNVLRMVVGESLDRDYVHRVLMTVILPLVTAPPVNRSDQVPHR
jgi:AcrR family transcriptional regulator